MTLISPVPVVPVVPFAAASAAADAPRPADPRVGPLLDLVQAMLHALGDIGTNFSSAIPDPVTRHKVITHAEDSTRQCRDRLNKILDQPL
ncbi:hypothetical protein [Kitasatospora cineracea]|uniref:Uncharacterized protein n=1 Tax=Kitasatospora cineracea TaxID=88074 RepID=A0A3N4RT86_9ACTN|nr:hypothetical protein [Kitasatospora cineracea]RPE27224.1 hypothetical protein EDD38_7368 [Kitasatospora cineracea]RPE27356.1 hypothetical protein EDD38_7501 [Kitasatospora cineracea]